MATENIDSLCQKAREAGDQRNPERARQLYLQALGLKSDSPDVHYGLATVCFQLKDLPSAAYHFKEVTRLDPLRAGAFINLGAVYNLLDQLDDAITTLRRGIQLDVHRAEGYYNLALVHRRKGQVDLAIQAYREALRVDPHMADAHYNLGNLYFDKRQHGSSIKHYKEALSLRPGWEKAQNALTQAETAQEEQQTSPPSAGPAARDTQIPTDNATKVDLDRPIDPNTCGGVLANLHRATIDSENHSRQFLHVLESEIEPAIKELSSCLLYPDSTAAELGECVEKFENAIASMRNVQRDLQTSIEKIRNIGNKLFK